MYLTQSWRWYGPNDPVTLQDVKQTGASGVVSALHHIKHGDVWPVKEIEERNRLIEDAGLKWVVVESVPVHEAIKTRSKYCDQYIDNYCQTLRNLATCGLNTVCYNFMPVLDWTRTNLEYLLETKAKALHFDWVDIAIFDKYMLERGLDELQYPEKVLEEADFRKRSYSDQRLKLLQDIILMGVPTEGAVTLKELKESIEIYKSIGPEGLRKNLVYFLNSIMDVCEDTNIRMTIHPDDPPYPIFGLPRIVSSKDDLEYITKAVDHEANGICFCTGSLAAGLNNDPVDILKSVGERVYFVHLRNVIKDESGSFYESDHLHGDVDMFSVMNELCRINSRRSEPIPFRPDHGHQMLDDLKKVTNPGYSAIGRLKGLAELRGLEKAIIRSMKVS